MEALLPATSVYDEVKKLTSDPGARRLAQYLDQIKERMDSCCPPVPAPVPLTSQPKSEDK